MSLQAGVWNFNGEQVDRIVLSKMGDQTVENEADDETIHIVGNVGMLYRPFHTTAESRLEHQPYVFGNAKVMTWDGRLDNREDLITQLGSPLHVHSTDLDIVAAAFDRWAVQSFTKIIGDWALAVWDSNERELILARDYIGVRHLFYYLCSRQLMWCSNLAPLALCGDQFSLSHEYVAGFLAFQPEAHLTPYQEIHSVPPAAFVRVCNCRATVHRYWEFKPWHKIRHKKDTDYEDHFRTIFRQSVRRRLRSYSPVLAALSGGYDSSSIVCVADSILSAEGADAPRLDTFSYYDSKEPNDDDFRHFVYVEKKRGRKGFHVDLASTGDSLSFQHPRFTAVPGFGSRTEVGVGLAHLIRSERYRVMLSGTGGDEMNGQALDPRVQMADLFTHLRLRQLLKDTTAWSVLTRRPGIQLLCDTLLELMPLTLRAQLRARGRPEPWINPRFARDYGLSSRQLENVRGTWFWRPLARDSLQTIVTLSRRLTYASPGRCEQRYPYLDQQLVEFLTAIPSDQLVKPGNRRFLMRRALINLVPEEILARRTKSTGARFYMITLEKHWNEVQRILECPLVSKLGYVLKDQLRAAVARTKSGQIPNHPVRLLKVLSLELWLRDVVNRGLIVHDGVAELWNAKEASLGVA